MSNASEQVERPCDAQSRAGAVRLLLQPRDHDLGGFSVRRALPTRQCRQVGPWVFFDHMGPAELGPGPGIDVRPHPHINLATVTYLFEGEIWHRDSLGSDQVIRPGAINLMVAGRGIVHSERERPAQRQAARSLHGLQLWLALPEAHEETEPAFYHHPADTIPEVEVDGVPVRVLIGTAYGVTSPVETYSDTRYLEAALTPGQHLRLPSDSERAVYVVEGEVSANGDAIPEHAMAVLCEGADVTLTAEQPARIALVGGAPLGERHMFWNFVSSRKDRIETAKRDWQEGRFEKVPGDADDFIPLP